MHNNQQVMPLNIFHRAAILANDLKSATCINWHALEAYYIANGKEKTCAVIEEEKKGANNIYLMHLQLAESALNF